MTNYIQNVKDETVRNGHQLTFVYSRNHRPMAAEYTNETIKTILKSSGAYKSVPDQYASLPICPVRHCFSAHYRDIFRSDVMIPSKFQQILIRDYPQMFLTYSENCTKIPTGHPMLRTYREIGRQMIYDRLKHESDIIYAVGDVGTKYNKNYYSKVHCLAPILDTYDFTRHNMFYNSSIATKCPHKWQTFGVGKNCICDTHGYTHNTIRNSANFAILQRHKRMRYERSGPYHLTHQNTNTSIQVNQHDERYTAWDWFYPDVSTVNIESEEKIDIDDEEPRAEPLNLGEKRFVRKTAMMIHSLYYIPKDDLIKGMVKNKITKVYALIHKFDGDGKYFNEATYEVDGENVEMFVREGNMNNKTDQHRHSYKHSTCKWLNHDPMSYKLRIGHSTYKLIWKIEWETSVDVVYSFQYTKCQIEDSPVSVKPSVEKVKINKRAEIIEEATSAALFRRNNTFNVSQILSYLKTGFEKNGISASADELFEITTDIFNNCVAKLKDFKDSVYTSVDDINNLNAFIKNSERLDQEDVEKECNEHASQYNNGLFNNFWSGSEYSFFGAKGMLGRQLAKDYDKHKPVDMVVWLIVAFLFIIEWHYTNRLYVAPISFFITLIYSSVNEYIVIRNRYRNKIDFSKTSQFTVCTVISIIGLIAVLTHQYLNFNIGVYGLKPNDCDYEMWGNKCEMPLQDWFHFGDEPSRWDRRLMDVYYNGGDMNIVDRGKLYEFPEFKRRHRYLVLRVHPDRCDQEWCHDATVSLSTTWTAIQAAVKYSTPETLASGEVFNNCPFNLEVSDVPDDKDQRKNKLDQMWEDCMEWRTMVKYFRKTEIHGFQKYRTIPEAIMEHAKTEAKQTMHNNIPLILTAGYLFAWICCQFICRFIIRKNWSRGMFNANIIITHTYLIYKALTNGTDLTQDNMDVHMGIAFVVMLGNWLLQDIKIFGTIYRVIWNYGWIIVIWTLFATVDAAKFSHTDNKHGIAYIAAWISILLCILKTHVKSIKKNVYHYTYANTILYGECVAQQNNVLCREMDSSAKIKFDKFKMAKKCEKKEAMWCYGPSTKHYKPRVSNCRDCYHNEVHCLMNRQLFDIKKAGSKSDLDENYMRNYLNWFTKHARTVFGDPHSQMPVTNEDWIDNMGDTKKKEAARLALRTKFNPKKHSLIAAFQKKECIVGKSKGNYILKPDKYASRLVQATSAENNARIGPYCLTVTNKLKRWWNWKNPFFPIMTYSSGMNRAQVGEWFDDAVKLVGDDGVVYWSDFEKFDKHYTRLHLQIQHKFMQMLVYCNKNMLRMLEQTIMTRGFMPHGTFYQIDGTRKSGFQDTTVGNTIMNGTAQLFMLIDALKITKIEQLLDLKVRMILLGDDAYIVTSKKIAQKLLYSNAMSKMGWSVKCGVTQFHEATFCSSTFVPSRNGSVLTGLPGRVLTKTFFAKKVLRTEALQKLYVFEVALGLLSEHRHNPIMRVLLERLLKLSAPTPKEKLLWKKKKKQWFDKEFNSQRWYKFTLESDNNTLKVSDQIYDYYLKRYGFTTQDLLGWYDYVKGIKKWNVVLDHPVVDRLIEIDVEPINDYEYFEIGESEDWYYQRDDIVMKDNCMSIDMDVDLSGLGHGGQTLRGLLGE
jgi:hypothetical protein